VAEFTAPEPIVKDTEVVAQASQDRPATEAVVSCDRCGFPMIERSCKLICLNCGSRIDCSDVSIYMD
jgi:hypothetical protein